MENSYKDLIKSLLSDIKLSLEDNKNLIIALKEVEIQIERNTPYYIILNYIKEILSRYNYGR